MHNPKYFVESRTKNLIEEENWAGLFASLPKNYRAVLIAIGKEAYSIKEISEICFMKYPTANNCLTKLRGQYLVERVAQERYQITLPGLCQYCRGKNLWKELGLSKEKIEEMLKKKISTFVTDAIKPISRVRYLQCEPREVSDIFEQEIFEMIMKKVEKINECS